jgi:DNA-binding HxlR family transcriptional regulator
MGSMMDRSALPADSCSVARTLAVVGEKWTLLVLREAFYGVRRFEDFADNLGLARNLLGTRLRKLVKHGILARRPYKEEGSRQRHEYRLTEKGIDLFPAIIALLQWGDRYLAGAVGPAVLVRHRSCGQPVSAVLSCAAGHQPLTARDTYPEVGPGARRRRQA